MARWRSYPAGVLLLLAQFCLVQSHPRAQEVGAAQSQALKLTLEQSGKTNRDDVVPPPVELPQTLSLDDALLIFRKRGLDLLIAEANVRSAEGAVKVAGAIPNPVLSMSVGIAISYSSSPYSVNNCLRGPASLASVTRRRLKTRSQANGV